MVHAVRYLNSNISENGWLPGKPIMGTRKLNIFFLVKKANAFSSTIFQLEKEFDSYNIARIILQKGHLSTSI